MGDIAKEPSERSSLGLADSLVQSTRIGLVGKETRGGWWRRLIDNYYGYGPKWLKKREEQLNPYIEEWEKEFAGRNVVPTDPDYYEYLAYLDLRLRVGPGGVKEQLGVEFPIEQDANLTIGDLEGVRERMLELVKCGEYKEVVGGKLEQTSTLKPWIVRTYRKLALMEQVLTEESEGGGGTGNFSSVLEKIREGKGYLENKFGIEVVPAGDKQRAARAKHKAWLLQIAGNLDDRAVQASLSAYGNKLEQEILHLAQVVNLAELTQQIAQEKGVDWDSLRQELEQLPRDQEGAKAFLTKIAPVVAYIVDHYEHDDEAYLVGQSMDKQKAACAGKEMMLGMILQEMLGIGARYGNVDVLLDNNFKGGHVVMHVPWGEKRVVELDLNSGERDTPTHCQSVILERISDELGQLPEKWQIASESGVQYIRKGAGKYEEWRSVYQLGEKSCHKVINEGEFPKTYIEYNNRASLHMNPAYLATLGSEKERQESLRAALSDYNETIRLNPNDATAYNNRASLHMNPAYLATLGSEKERQESLRAALSDYNETIRLNPNDGLAKANFFTFLFREFWSAQAYRVWEMLTRDELLAVAERVYGYGKMRWGRDHYCVKKARAFLDEMKKDNKG